MNKCKRLKYDNVNNVKSLFVVKHLLVFWQKLKQCFQLTCILYLSCLSCSSCQHNLILTESSRVDMVGLSYVYTCGAFEHLDSFCLTTELVLFLPSVRSPDKQMLNTEVCFSLPTVSLSACSSLLSLHLHVFAQICLMPPK